MPDSYRCIVCGSDDLASRVMSDGTDYGFLCFEHFQRLLELTKSGIPAPITERLKAIGVIFGERDPIPLTMTDEEFLKSCGITPYESWDKGF